jgi:hypothetical protein
MRYFVLIGVLLAGGCQGLGSKNASPDCQEVAYGACEDGAPACPQPSKCSSPGESNPCQEIHVRVPPQKVVVSRKPEAAAGSQCKLTEQQVTTLQHAATAQEVLLVPRTVLVPFVQQTPVGILRATTLQQNQVGISTSQATQTSVAQAESQTRDTSAQVESLRKSVNQLEATLQALAKSIKALQDQQAAAARSKATAPSACPANECPPAPPATLPLPQQSSPKQ